MTMSFHHVVLDGWSLATLLTEMFRHYWWLQGKDEQGIDPAPALEFREFVALEREAMAAAECRDYWQRSVEGSTARMLPRWTTGTGNESGEGGEPQVETHEVAISGELSSSLKAFAQKAHVPLKSVLLAAHLRVLGLLSGQRDVVTGVVGNGRPESRDGERVVGLFLNTLPFRQQLSGGTWQELAREVFENERQMMPYRRYPLAELQRVTGRAELFEVAFNYIHFHVFQEALQLEGMQLFGWSSFTETNFPFLVNFGMDPTSRGLYLGIQYDAGLFSAAQVAGIAGYYERALAAMAANPEGRYRDVTLLGEEERRRLLPELSRPVEAAEATETGRSLQELFEEQAAARRRRWRWCTKASR